MLRKRCSSIWSWVKFVADPDLPPLPPILGHGTRWLAIDKPAGMLSVPGRGPAKADCAARRVQAHFPDARPVHRLDMETSGILLFALGAAAHRNLSIAFAERRIGKTYEAVVEGLPVSDRGEISLPLVVDWPRRPRQKIDPDHGKPALTRYCVLERMPTVNRARLRLEPITGRSHQLRVHLRALGHPIVGDTLYGATQPAARLMLHATQLRFTDDFDSNVQLVSPAPF